MRWLKIIGVLLLGSLMLVSAGCGLSSKPSGIQGKVVDSSGVGVAAATVLIEGVPGSVTTASDGSYTISKIAPGSYSVIATKQGYLAAGSPKVTAQRTKVLVSVKAGETVQAPNIVLIAGGASVDTLALSSATPEIGTSFLAGAKQTISVDVNYVLQSVNTAHVGVWLYMKDNWSKTTTIASDSEPVTKGSGTKSFSIPISVPVTTQIQLQIELFDENGSMLAVNAFPGYVVVTQTAPSAPTLKIDQTAFNGIKLSWSGGNLYDLKSLTLWRNSVHSSSAIATLQPLQETYTDYTVSEQVSYQYHLQMQTTSGREYTSNNVTITTPRVGLSAVTTGTNVGNAVFVTSPTQNTLYMADNDNSKLLTYNTTSNTKVRESALAKSLKAMTITSDGLHIYGAATDGSIVEVDATTLAAKDTPIYTGLDNPTAITVSPDGSQVYAVSAKGVHSIDIASRTELHTYASTNITPNIAVARDGAHLFAYNGSSLIALRTDTLALAKTFNVHAFAFVTNPVLDEIYLSSGYVYDTRSPWMRLEYFPSNGIFPIPAAISPDGSRFLATYDTSSGSSYSTSVYIYEKVGITWQVVDTITLDNFRINAMYLSADGQKIYLHGAPTIWSGKPIHLQCIDLAAREAAKL